MDELELTRSQDDRRRFDLDGYGSLRKQGLLDPSVELLLLDGTVLRTEKLGFFRMVLQAYDASGENVGEFRSRAISSGGELSWRDQVYEVISEAWWGTRYLVTSGDRPVVRLRCSGWGGSTPVRVTVEDPTADPGLVLFLTWVVQRIVANNSAGNASAGAV